MNPKVPPDQSHLNSAVFKALEQDQPVELTCLLHAMASDMAERLTINSSNNTRQPSLYGAA